MTLTYAVTAQVLLIRRVGMAHVFKRPQTGVTWAMPTLQIQSHVSSRAPRMLSSYLMPLNFVFSFLT